ncbi:MAG: VanZ family protein [Bacteroidales bacterium]|nr:VanZ family protein [Bacteroidales bacterium]
MKLGLAIVWTLFILIGSAISGNSINQFQFLHIPYIDKVVHFIWYFVLYVLWYSYMLNRKYIYVKLKFRFLLFFTIILFGFVLEVFQKYFFIKRSAEMADFYADSLGTCWALFLFFKLYQSKYLGKYL